MIGQKEYPAYQTMGAILAFQRDTGKEITSIAGDLVELLKYLYCVVRSACKRDGVDFEFDSVEQFADGVSLEDFTAWANSLNDKETQGKENELPGDGSKNVKAEK